MQKTNNYLFMNSIETSKMVDDSHKPKKQSNKDDDDEDPSYNEVLNKSQQVNKGQASNRKLELAYSEQDLESSQTNQIDSKLKKGTDDLEDFVFEDVDEPKFKPQKPKKNQATLESGNKIKNHYFDDDEEEEVDDKEDQPSKDFEESDDENDFKIEGQAYVQKNEPQTFEKNKKSKF